jgi:hypothetical protein
MRGAFQMLDGEKKLYSLRKPFIVHYFDHDQKLEIIIFRRS